MFRPLVIPALFCVTSAHADPVDFDRDVLPFLKDNCIACHNKTTTKGGLNMETPELMAEGGDSDAGLIPGKGAESIIYQAAAHTWDSEMPPKGNKVDAVNLTTRQLAMLKDWIDQGARPSPKRDKVIAWEPLPAGVQPIYALAASPQGGFVAAARANQISLYHLPTQSLVTRLTDESLLKSGLYKQPGVAHRDLVQALAFSPDGARLATGSFREVKIWKLSLPAPAPGASAKFTATQEPDNTIKLNEGTKLLAHIKSDFAAEQALAQHTLAAARAALEVSYQNEAIKKAETAATDQTNRLKKANELAELAKKSLEDKKKDLKTKQDARAAADKAATDVDAEVAKATTGKPDDALAKKLAESQANAAKAAAEFSQAQAALKKAETSVAAAEAKKTPELAELIALAKVGVGEQMKALKPKEEAKSAADKAAKEIAAQVAALPKMKADDALLKKQAEAKEKAEKTAADLKVAEEALTRGEAAVTDAAKEIKLVTENEKLAKQSVADEKARLEVVKKTSLHCVIGRRGRCRL